MSPRQAKHTQGIYILRHESLIVDGDINSMWWRKHSKCRFLKIAETWGIEKIDTFNTHKWPLTFLPWYGHFNILRYIKLIYLMKELIVVTASDKTHSRHLYTNTDIVVSLYDRCQKRLAQTTVSRNWLKMMLHATVLSRWLER